MLIPQHTTTITTDSQSRNILPLMEQTQVQELIRERGTMEQADRVTEEVQEAIQDKILLPL